MFEKWLQRSQSTVLYYISFAPIPLSLPPLGSAYFEKYEVGEERIIAVRGEEGGGGPQAACLHPGTRLAHLR